MNEVGGGAPLVSLLTPQSPSGIAVLSLQGSGAGAILARIFMRAEGTAGKLPSPSRAAHGFLRADGRLLDEVLVVNTGGPGERFEICCHGGSAAASAILEALVALGARARSWYELVEKETLEYDLLAALLRSEGPGQAAILAHLLNGGLEEAFRELLEALGTLKPVRPAAGPQDLDRALALADRLAGSYALGRYLADPPRVVILGPPNAGKSTLFNAILGEHRALTSKIPGTTRDPVEASFLLDGFPVRLYDLPGREDAPSSPLQAEALEEARLLMENADLHLRVIDAAAMVKKDRRPFEQALSSERRLDARGIGAINIFNKTDLLDSEERTLRLPEILSDCTNSTALSSLRELGMDALFEKMKVLLGLDILLRRFEPQIFMREQLIFILELKTALLGRDWDPGLYQRLSGYLVGKERHGRSRSP